MRPVLGLALCSLLITAANASDFSKLAEPSFARSLLISSVRQQQIECAGLGLFRSARGESPGKKGARLLADAVSRRLSIEVGNEAYAKEIVEGRAADYADPTKTDHFWVEVRDYMTRKCEPYFSASGNGESQLSAALGPMPTKPLTLPSEEQCLATADYVDQTKLLDWDEDFGKVLRKDRFGNVDPQERARRQAVVEGGIEVLREKKPDKDHLEMMLIACLHTVAEAAKRLGPDISDQLER